MVHVPFYRNYGKTFKKPRRPYEKKRLDAELKLVGEYSLRCKRELWRVQYALSRIRNNARTLLTLDEKNLRRIFEGEALLRRMFRYGLLDDTQNNLDYVLALTVENVAFKPSFSNLEWPSPFTMLESSSGRGTSGSLSLHLPPPPSPPTPNVKAFVIDLFYSYALQPASSLSIPVFYFFTSGEALKRSQKLTYLLKLEGFSL